MTDASKGDIHVLKQKLAYTRKLTARQQNAQQSKIVYTL